MLDHILVCVLGAPNRAGALEELLRSALALLGEERGCVVESQPRDKLRVIATRGLTLAEDQMIDERMLGTMRRALNSPNGEAYWTVGDKTRLARLTSATDVEIGSNIVFRIKLPGPSTNALLNIESAVTEMDRSKLDVIRNAIRIFEKHLARVWIESEEIARLVGVDLHTRKKEILSLAEELRRRYPSDRFLLGMAADLEAIRDVLSVNSKVVLGALESPRPIDLVSLVRKLVKKEFRFERIARAGLTFAKGRIIVLGVVVGIQLILKNLIANSAKHAQGTDVELEVALTGSKFAVMRYTDGGKAPRNADRVCLGEVAGNGHRDIVFLADRYGWPVRTYEHPETGSLVWEFSIPCPQRGNLPPLS